MTKQEKQKILDWIGENQQEFAGMVTGTYQCIPVKPFVRFLNEQFPDEPEEWQPGDKVRITDRIYGHDFSIEEIVTLERSDPYDNSWHATAGNRSSWIWPDEAEKI